MDSWLSTASILLCTFIPHLLLPVFWLKISSTLGRIVSVEKFNCPSSLLSRSMPFSYGLHHVVINKQSLSSACCWSWQAYSTRCSPLCFPSLPCRGSCWVLWHRLSPTEAETPSLCTAHAPPIAQGDSDELLQCRWTTTPVPWGEKRKHARPKDSALFIWLYLC